MRTLLATTLLGILMAMPAAARSSSDAAALERAVIESAEGSGQHEALAHFYRSKASIARADADRLEVRARSPLYQWGNAGQRRYLRAQNLEKAAKLRAEVERHEAQARIHDANAAETAALRDGGADLRADARP